MNERKSLWLVCVYCFLLNEYATLFVDGAVVLHVMLFRYENDEVSQRHKDFER